MESRSIAEVTASPSFEQECVLFFEEIVQLFGVPKSVGQIYGLLYASPRPLCFSDIVERLDISKGSASQGIHLLRALGAITEAGSSTLASDPNSPRREVRGIAYKPELSLRELVAGLLRERIAPMATAGSERLKRLVELAKRAPVHSKFYLDRATQVEIWQRRFTAVLPLLIAFLGPKNKAK